MWAAVRPCIVHLGIMQAVAAFCAGALMAPTLRRDVAVACVPLVVLILAISMACSQGRPRNGLARRPPPLRVP